MSQSKPWVPAFLMIASVLAMKVIYIASMPLSALAETPWLIDDSFIFARVARNLAQGHGYSFDGIHTTSGAPPAWTFLIAGFHLLFSKISAVKAAMMLSSACEALAQFFLFDLARRLISARAGLLAAMLLAFSSICFFQSMNAMETSLYCLL
ncbi:MAG: glycosyltransferase family 39 protein, partial [Candidatus Sumerlaeota bacterium]